MMFQVSHLPQTSTGAASIDDYLMYDDDYLMYDDVSPDV